RSGGIAKRIFVETKCSGNRRNFQGRKSLVNHKRSISQVALLIMMFVALFARAGSAQQSAITNAGKTKPSLTITAISPTSAVAGSPALNLTVQGTNFVKSDTVQLNGSARATTFVSSTQLQAQVTQADLATARAIAVTVV